MRWILQNARDAFISRRDKWDALNKRCNKHVLLDSIFVELLIQHFASNETLLVEAASGNNGGMAVVERARPGFWQTFQPSQGPLGLILVESQNNLKQQVGDLMRSLPGYPLGFSVTQQDPDFTAFGKVSHCENVATLDYITTPRITLTGTFEDYWKARGRDLTRNITRRLRRAAEEGVDLELVEVRDPGKVAACIREYGGLEASGWKGKEGTAITAENIQGIFYRQILEKFCERGEGVVYRLLMNGNVVASDLCLERNGMLIVLKVAYDETVKNISPSFILRKMVLERLFSEERIGVVEFYGRARDWHMKWTNELRTMFHLNFYRSAWVPVMRRFVKKCGLSGSK